MSRVPTSPPWGSKRRLLLSGGSIYQANLPAATSMVIDGATIAWVGQEPTAFLERSGLSIDHRIDLDGASVTAGFVDAHVHATSTGLTLTGLDLTTCTSLADALALIEKAARVAKGATLLGHGWDETRWSEGRAPTRQEIDRATWGSVVYLSRIDVHSAVVSSALLGTVPAITEATGFHPDGVVSQHAHHLAREAALGNLGTGQRRRAQESTRDHAAARGIVAFHEMAGPVISSADDLRELLQLCSQTPGPLVTGYWGELANQGGIEHARELGAIGVAGDLFIDGSIGSHTACLRHGYDDEPANTGAEYLTVQQVRDHVLEATRAGLQAGFHVIGDRATDLVMAGFRDASEICGTRALRVAGHRLEHAEMLDDDHIATMAALGITASMQPMFDALWAGKGGMYEQRLGAGRAATMNRLADVTAAGVHLAIGSDSPVTSMEPWLAIRASMNHHQKSQRLTLEQAFAAHTKHGWQAVGEAGTGELVAGAPAHLAIWDSPMAAGGLPDIEAGAPRCLRTLVAGATVHDSQDLIES